MDEWAAINDPNCCQPNRLPDVRPIAWCRTTHCSWPFTTCSFHGRNGKQRVRVRY